MTITTFFTAEPPSEGQGQVIRHFHNSWRKRGWDVHMLNPRTYAKHPDKKAYLKALERVEPLSERQRMLRYLAMDALGSHPCLFAEYDVINFDFENQSEDPFDDSTSMLVGQGIMHIGSGVARKIVRGVLRGFNPDMTLSALHGSQGYRCTDWMKSPLVHFNKIGCEDNPKHKVIESCGRFY
jgi:hypothetical protein